MLIHLCNEEISIERATLKQWIFLDDIKSKTYKSTSRDNVVKYIHLYLSSFLHISEEKLLSCEWFDIALIYYNCLDLNTPNIDFPIFKKTNKDNKDDTLLWNYEGRTWYIWCHELASKYGWSIEYIANMDVDDAIALMQEIIIEKQLDKEWDWVRSENAYVYNENTKKSDFKPLDRPEWMQEHKKHKESATVKYKASMIPLGNVIRFNANQT